MSNIRHNVASTPPGSDSYTAAIVRIDLQTLRALLQLPVDATIDHAWVSADQPDQFSLRVKGAGWDVRYGQIIPAAPPGLIEMQRHGKTRLTRLTIDWQLPSHPGPITTLRSRPAQRGIVDWAELIAIGLLGMVVCLMWVGMCAWEDHRCHAKAAAMGMPAQWSASTGCLVQPKRGQWVPLRNWRMESST